MGKRVFVTVGTTCFDLLIQTVDNSEIRRVLRSLGYSELSMQIGKGIFEPATGEDVDGLKVDFFRMKTSLSDDVSQADLIISHAGAGSILEALEANKSLVVVVNDTLMGNHQMELALQFSKLNNLTYCTCRSFMETLQKLPIIRMEPYEPGHSSRFATFLDKTLGLV